MSTRIDKSWTIIASHHTDEVDRCVDVFSRPDGSFGFEEFRRDPEDMGAWTPMGYCSAESYASADAALVQARRRVGWLSDVLNRRTPEIKPGHSQ